MPVFNANSMNSDQTTYSTASDVGLNCLLGTLGMNELAFDEVFICLC